MFRRNREFLMVVIITALVISLGGNIALGINHLKGCPSISTNIPGTETISKWKSWIW